jgi:hypothetical protein
MVVVAPVMEQRRSREMYGQKDPDKEYFSNTSDYADEVIRRYSQLSSAATGA